MALPNNVQQGPQQTLQAWDPSCVCAGQLEKETITKLDRVNDLTGQLFALRNAQSGPYTRSKYGPKLTQSGFVPKLTKQATGGTNEIDDINQLDDSVYHDVISFTIQDRDHDIFIISNAKKLLEDPVFVQTLERLAGLNKEQFLEKCEYINHEVRQFVQKHNDLGDHDLKQALVNEVPAYKESIKLEFIIDQYNDLKDSNPEELDGAVEYHLWVEGLGPGPKLGHKASPTKAIPPKPTQYGFSPKPTQNPLDAKLQQSPMTTQQTPGFRPVKNLQISGEQMISQATDVLKLIHGEIVKNNGKVSPNIERILKQEIDTLDIYMTTYDETLRERMHFSGKTQCFQNVTGFQKNILDVAKETAQLAKELVKIGQNCKSIMS